MSVLSVEPRGLAVRMIRNAAGKRTGCLRVPHDLDTRLSVYSGDLLYAHDEYGRALGDLVSQGFFARDASGGACISYILTDQGRKLARELGPGETALPF